MVLYESGRFVINGSLQFQPSHMPFYEVDLKITSEGIYEETRNLCFDINIKRLKKIFPHISC